MDILAPDVSRLEIKVEWMNGETFVIFNAVRFSSPPVERDAVLLNQREFHTGFDFCGCQHIFGC